MKKIIFFVIHTILLPILLFCQTGEAWLTVKTGHFTFVFQERDKEAVRELVFFSEEAYEKVTGYFGSYPSEIRCVIAGNTDIANAASMSLPPSIVINVASPEEPWLGARTGNWLESVLIHELTHYVHINDTRGPFAFFSALLGDDVKAAHMAFLYKGWMIEGISTNLETHFTDGGRGRNPFFEMYYKAMILEDALFSAEQANYSSRFPPAGRIYVAGYMLVHYLMETYGTEVFSRIHEEYIGFPFLGPERAIIGQTGKSTSEHVADMKAYYAELFRESAGKTGGTRVSPQGIGDYSSPLVTERGLLLYRSTPEKRSALVFFDPVTLDEEVVIEADLHDRESFTADESGDTIVFSSDTYDLKSPMDHVYADLYLYSVRSKTLSRITREGHLYHPVLSTDGSRLFAVERTGSYSRLVEVDLSTGGTRIAYEEAGTNVYNPAISGDGMSLAFARNVRGMQDIYVMRVGGESASTGASPVSSNGYIAAPLFGNDPAGDYYPSFIDSDTVVFSSDREGSLRLYSYSIPGKRLLRIADDPVAAISGKVVGGSLYYSSYSSTGYCLKQYPLDALDNTEIPIVSERIPHAYAFVGLPPASGYVDLPAPLFWFPFPSLGYSTIENPDVGFGFYVIAGSLLRRSTWDLAFSFYPAYLQPRIRFRGSYDFDDFSISLFLRHDYAVSESDTPGYAQKTSCSLETRVPFVSVYELGAYTDVSITTGLYYRYLMQGDALLPFAGIGSAGALGGRSLLMAYSGLDLGRAASGSDIDFFAPWAIIANLSAESVIPVFPDEGYGYGISLGMSFNVPSLIAHQVISPGLAAGYSYGALAPDGEGVVVLTNLDYLMPMAILDVPFLFGTSLLDASARLFWNYDLAYSPVSGVVTPGRLMWTGAELRLTAGYGAYYTFPLVAGIRVSFSPFNAEPWNVMTNVSFYLNLELGGIVEESKSTARSAGLQTHRSTVRGISTGQISTRCNTGLCEAHR